MRSSIESLVKNLCKDNFKCLTQEFDCKVLNLVKQKRFFCFDSINCFEMCKEKLSNKERFYLVGG